MKKKKEQSREVIEDPVLCEKCGNKMEEENEEMICPKCDTEIDFFGEEEQK